MRGDRAMADAHARELNELAERAGSDNARLLGLVQRYVRLVSEGRAGELTDEFAEIVGLIPDDPRAALCAQAFLNAHRGQFAEARADLDRVVAELAYRVLKPYAGQCAVEGNLAGSWGSVAAHLGLLARYLGRAADADAHFARAVELDAAAGAAVAARTREWAGGWGSVSGGDALFHLDGHVWTLRYAGRTVRMRDSKGLRDLAVLVIRPGEHGSPGTGSASTYRPRAAG